MGPDLIVAYTLIRQLLASRYQDTPPRWAVNDKYQLQYGFLLSPACFLAVCLTSAFDQRVFSSGSWYRLCPKQVSTQPTRPHPLPANNLSPNLLPLDPSPLNRHTEKTPRVARLGLVAPRWRRRVLPARCSLAGWADAGWATAGVSVRACCRPSSLSAQCPLNLHPQPL